MKKITRKEKVAAIIEKEIPLFKTADGIEFRTEKEALKHEALIKEFPLLSKNDIEWLEDLNDDFELEELKETIKTSNKVLLLMGSEGSGLCLYENIDPEINGVTAVVKLLQYRNIGMNAHEYIDGIIYKGESVSVEFNQEHRKNCTAGKGRNIKEILCQPQT